MHVVKQVLARATATAHKVCSMDFLIVQECDLGAGRSYRLEWRMHDGPDSGRSFGPGEGSFAAESIEDAEDMGFQYFGIAAQEWRVPSDHEVRS